MYKSITKALVIADIRDVGTLECLQNSLKLPPSLLSTMDKLNAGLTINQFYDGDHFELSVRTLIDISTHIPPRANVCIIFALDDSFMTEVLEKLKGFSNFPYFIIQVSDTILSKNNLDFPDLIKLEAKGALDLPRLKKLTALYQYNKAQLSQAVESYNKSHLENAEIVSNIKPSTTNSCIIL